MVDRMKMYICFTMLLIGSAYPLLTTGCSTTHQTPKQKPAAESDQIPHRAYNSETRSFDRPWTYGQLLIYMDKERGRALQPIVDKFESDLNVKVLIETPENIPESFSIAA